MNLTIDSGGTWTQVNGSSNDSFPNILIEWDDWDLSLWTEKQREILEQGAIPRHVHIALGILLTLIVLFGLTANSAILYVFSRFKRLRTPANVFIINLTICDFFACCLHPLAVYSAFRGRWSFGQTGCNLYGMGVAFFGLNSIVTLSAIACERYIVITSSSCRPAVAKWRITRRQAQKVCAGIWLHCAALVTPPLIFGWSSYQPEGVLVTCSWDYTTRTLSNRLYYLYLLFFGFVLPISVLTFCYAAIFRFIVRSSREITRLIMTSDGTTSFSKSTVSFRKRRRQTDVRTALIILSLAVLCFTAWTPYAIVSLIGQFGPVDEDGQPRKLSPMATAIPAFLAKTAIVFDPLVYGFSHPQFRNSIRQLLRHNSSHSRDGHNNTTMIVMRRPTPRNCQQSPMVFSSSSRSNRINKDTASRKLSFNDPCASTSLAACRQSSLRFADHPDTAGNIQKLRKSESLRKMCMNKRNKNLNIPGGRQSLSAAEEVSVANSSSLRLMMLQEESEFHLFRQQQSAEGKLQRAVKRERMMQLLSNGHNKKEHEKPRPERRRSEPDLMRCSIRVIADAPILSWEEYRRQRKEYMRSIFFRSAGNLLQCSSVAAKGFSEYPILLLTTGCDEGSAEKSVTPSVGRKLSMTVESVDRFKAVNTRLTEKMQRLDGAKSTGRSSTLSVQLNRSSSLVSSPHRPQYQQRRRYSSSPIHDECCECAYLPLSQTVTLVKMEANPTSTVESGRAQPQWRACMVSGRDSLSRSLNSP